MIDEWLYQYHSWCVAAFLFPQNGVLKKFLKIWWGPWKSLLAKVAGNFAHVKTNNEMVFLDYGPARCSVAHFLGCFRDLRALRTYPIYSICYYLSFILRRGMKACASEKLDLSFRARPSPNRQNLDESVWNLVYKLNNYWKSTARFWWWKSSTPNHFSGKGLSRIVWYKNISL